MQTFRGKKIQELKIEKGRELSPLIKSAREGDGAKSAISRIKEDLLKRTMSQTVVNAEHKPSNSLRALASLTKLAKTCYHCDILKEKSVGVLKKAHMKFSRYLEKYYFRKEERKALSKLKDIVREKYELASSLSDLDS